MHFSEKPRGALTPIADVLPQAFKHLVTEKWEDLTRLRACWTKVVGGVMAEKSRVVSLRDGEITLAVKNSVWLAEMRLRQNEILLRLREELPKMNLQSVRFRLG